MYKPKPEYVAADYGAMDKTSFQTFVNGTIVRIDNTVGTHQATSQMLIDLISTNTPNLK